MHELAFAQQIVRTVLDVMRRQGGSAVRSIDVEVGTLEGIPAERLRYAFGLESKDTPLEGVPLEVTTAPAVASCPSCGTERDLMVLVEGHGGPIRMDCPRCAVPMELRGGRGLVVRSAAIVLSNP